MNTLTYFEKLFLPVQANHLFSHWAKIVFLVLILFLIHINTVAAQSKNYPPSIRHHFQNDLPQQKLAHPNWILEEGENELTIENLRSGNIKDAQILDLTNQPIFNFRSHRNYWFNLQFTTDYQIKDAGLALNFVGDCWPFEFTFKNITAYNFFTFASSTIGKSGLTTPYRQRDFPEKINTSLIRVNLLPNDTLTTWIKITKGEGCNLGIDLELKSYENVYAPQLLTKYMSSHLILIGANLALFLITVLIYFWFRDPIYIWFIAFQLFLLAARISEAFRDDIYNLFFANHPFLFSIIAPFFAVSWLCCLLQFGREYINTKSYFPRIHSIFRWAIIALCSITIISTIFRIVPIPSVDLWYSIRKILIGLSFITVFCSLLYLLWSNNKLAKFYSIGTLLPFGAMLLRLIEMNVSERDSARSVSLIISLGVVMTMLLALAYRFRVVFYEKEEAMTEKLNAEVKNSTKLKKINTAFNKFVPQTFLNFLGKKSILDVHLGDHVEKQVTILFSDIRNYTSISEKMTPEENFLFVNAFNQRMGPIIQQHEGFINQYLGDGIMAIFPEEPEQTLRAAISMQHTLTNYNQKRIDKNKNPIRMGIGLHIGSLVMGITGDKERLDAATISDTVNVVSRIENLTKHYGVSILISEKFYHQIKNKSTFHFRYLGKVLVKGKQKPVGVYECFDGDILSQLNLKKQTLAHFEKGLQHYFSKEFSEAIKSFNLILEKNPQDRTTIWFSNRATKYLSSPVGEDWKGIEKMDKK